LGDGGVKAKAALIRPDSGIELNAESSVHLYVSFVVHPGYAERYNALGLNYPLDDALFFELGMKLDDLLARFQNLAYSLKEFRFIRIPSFDGVKNALQIRICDCHDKPPNNNILKLII
jgi:hypothetical protein